MRHLSGIGLAIALAALPGVALAQNYPVRPIRIIVANTAGSAMDMVTRLIGSRMAGVDFVHIPFKGTIPSLTGLMSGQVHFSFASISTIGPPVKAGKLRALAQGGATRSPVIPNIPTIAEIYPDFRATTWYALFAPRATPPAIVTKLNAEVMKTLAEPAIVRRLADQGLDPAPGTPADLSAHMRAETDRFARIVKASKITAASF